MMYMLKKESGINKTMKYMGSKNRIAKEILPLILKNIENKSYYVEPFVGGCNMIDKVPNTIIRIGNDSNEYLIAMWKELQSGWIPPKLVSEDFYKAVQRNKKDYPNHIVGYIGFNLSFGAIFFSCYRRDSMGKRDYSLESYNNVTKQLQFIKDIKFFNKKMQFNELEIDALKNIKEFKDGKSIIYCDPPYKGTAGYKDSKDFNYEGFYDYCRELKKLGNDVFISEYEMPNDFKCIWQKEIMNNLAKKVDAKKGIEKLFTL